MIDLISILIGILIGQASGILISTISLENAENRVDESYEKYLEKEKRCEKRRVSKRTE